MMKKLNKIIFILLLVIVPSFVNAAGGISVSTGSLSIKKGSSSSFVITASNAAGRIDISSSSGVATISQSSVWLDNSSTTIIVTGLADGNATINVYLTDVATYDGEIIGGTRSIAVNVFTPQPVTPQNPSNPTTPTNPPKNVEDNRSKNNNFKEFGVEGFELSQEGNIYKLTVQNNVSTISIKADKEDEKASITGTGVKELQMGENKFDVTVTAENGSTNTRTIIVTRKEGYFVEDIDTVIKESEDSEISIILTEDKISKDVLNTIKGKDKTVSFGIYDNNKKLLYSWTLDAKNIKKVDDINTKISYESKNDEKIIEASNYADGLVLNIENKGKLPESAKLTVYVGNKFKDYDTVNIYRYISKDNKIKKVYDKVMVKNGYIEFNIEDCSEYFITKASFSNLATTILIIIVIFETLAICCYLLYKFIFKTNKKAKKKEK